MDHGPASRWVSKTHYAGLNTSVVRKEKIMAVERIDYSSDNEYQQALRYEEYEYYYWLKQQHEMEASIEAAAIEQGK
jgi:hypothetical protein